MQPAYQQLIIRWLKGHPDACTFIDTLFDVVHTLDDLVDQDHAVTTQHVQSTFYTALIDLPRNPFYVQHFSLLNGALQLAYLNWRAANVLEAHEDQGATKDIAFILRSSYADLITLCASIIGGQEWAVTVATEVRLHASNEGKAAYLASLTKEPRNPFVIKES